MVILCRYKKEFTLSVLYLPFMYNFNLETAENEGFTHQLTLLLAMHQITFLMSMRFMKRTINIITN